MEKQLKDKPRAWVVFDYDLLTLWNYTSGPSGRILNTKLLFQKAARPHFDFYLKYIDNLFLLDEIGLDVVKDEKYKSELSARSVLQKKDFTARIADLQTQSGVVVLNLKGRELPNLPENQFAVVQVSEKYPLANTEVLWRKIRKALSEIDPKVVLVNLGVERAWVIPRITLVLGVEAIDVSFTTPKAVREEPGFVSKVGNVLKRKVVGLFKS